MNVFKRLHHFLVPHERNNHRAKALHHDTLLAYILILGIFNLGINFIHRQAPGILGYATDIRVEQLLESTNAKRSEAGLPQLTLNGTLSQAAQAKASDMFSNNYWAHNSPTGKTPWDFIVAAGYRYTLAGENLAKNFDTSSAVVDAWMASQTHKDNLLKDGYREVGFAVVNGVLNGEETTLVVQMFGSGESRAVAQIPQVRAEEPQAQPTAVPRLTAVPLPTAMPEPSDAAPVEVPAEPAARTEDVSSPSAVSLADPTQSGLFAGVRITPAVNIPGLTREVTYIFTGLIIGVLAVDAFIVSRKKLVRLAGHNVAHILFLTTVLISGLTMTRGSLI